MTKKLFKNEKGNIHFGENAPEGFSPASKNDALKALAKLGARKLWRCHVCNDIHLGESFPDPCPTCFAEQSFIEINKNEFKLMIGI